MKELYSIRNQYGEFFEGMVEGQPSFNPQIKHAVSFGSEILAYKRMFSILEETRYELTGAYEISKFLVFG